MNATVLVYNIVSSRVVQYRYLVLLYPSHTVVSGQDNLENSQHWFFRRMSENVRTKATVLVYGN